MEYFHSRYPITVADYSKIQEAYILAFRSQRIQEVLIDMCLDKIDSQKHFYTTEALVKTSGSSIYKEIGGFKEVKKLTEIFLSKLNSDSEMGSYFCVVAAPLLGNYLTQFVCVLLDNETMNSATRERLKNTHRSLNIQDKAFNRTKEAMRTTLRELNIRPEMEERIMEKLETARQEITCKGDLGDFGRELSERDSVRKRFSVRNSVSGTAPNFSKDQEERQQKSGGFLALLRKTPSMNRKQVDPLTIS